MKAHASMAALFADASILATTGITPAAAQDAIPSETSRPVIPPGKIGKQNTEVASKQS